MQKRANARVGILTMKPIGNGVLFITDERRRFNAITRQRYDSLCGRMERKGYSAMPFTVEQYRAHALDAMGGYYEGAVTCRYCSRPLDFADSVGDHAVPLSRGGSPNLSNIDFICADDNDRKGSMLPVEYLMLLAFVERELPLARTDILARLQKATKLAASMRFNMARISELKTNGAWAKAGKRKGKPILAKEDF